MASNQELVRLFNDGELGKLLAKTFNGERQYVFPCEDHDVVVVFKSEQETPQIESIAQAVTQHYTNKGYVVEPDLNKAQDCFQALISFGSKDDHGCVGIVITTNYPLSPPKQGRAGLRIQSNIMF